MEKIEESSSVSLYQQIKTLILAKIEKGDYKIGDQIPSTSEISVIYRVSTITVRRAVSDLINEGVLKGIHGKGTFVVSPGKKIKENKGDKVIGVIFTNLASNPFFAEILQGIENEVGLAGYHVITITTNNSFEKECRVLEEVKRKGVEGIILTPATTNHAHSENQILKSFLAEAFPIVFVDRKNHDLPVDYVTSDNEKGGFFATTYLLKLGHRRIAFILGVNANTVQERLKGYRKALEEYNVPFDPILIKHSYIEL